MSALQGQLALANGMSIWEGFELVLPDQTIRFHAGTNEFLGSVVWQGNFYTPWPINAVEFATPSQGSPARPKLQVGNFGGTISALCRQYEDLLGAKLKRRRTLVKYLDAVNFPKKNLLRYSESFESSTWGKQSQLVVWPNAAIAPDGTFSAEKVIVPAGQSNGWAYQSLSLFPATTYTLSVFAKAVEDVSTTLTIYTFETGEATATFNIASGLVASSSGVDGASITPVGNGWFLCSITKSTAPTASGARVDVGRKNTAGNSVNGHLIWGSQLEVGPSVTEYEPNIAVFVSRGSTGTYFDAQGVMQTAGINTARFDFDPVTMLPKGLLIEEARTNFATNSQFLSGQSASGGASINTGWSGVGLDKGYSIPGGTGTITWAYSQSYTPTPATSYALSVFFRYSDGRAPTFGDPANAASVLNSFNLVLDGQAIQPSLYTLLNCGGGIYRIGVSGASQASAAVRGWGLLRRAGQGDATGDPAIVVTGVQIELGSFFTSHIPTVSGQVTRAADITTSFAGDNPYANPAEEYPVETWIITRKANETSAAIEFELGSPLDLQGVKLPRRQVVAGTCLWAYRSGECGYAGPPVADYANQPTSDPTKDQCSRTLRGCKIRFGEYGELPFGGFPGIARVPRL